MTQGTIAIADPVHTIEVGDVLCVGDKLYRAVRVSGWEVELKPLGRSYALRIWLAIRRFIRRL